MKKLFVLGIAALTLFSCQKPQKIAFVNNAELINEYQEKKDQEAMIKEKIEKFDKKNDSIGRAFQMEIQDAQIKSAKMSKKNQEELMMQLQKKQAMLQQQFQIGEKAISDESKAINDSLISTVKKFVKKYGEDNDYDFIIGQNDNTGSLYHGKEKHDVTKAVLDELNKAYAAKKK
ncbi:MAG: OmpH family outer membrane protein [Bacteroidota bacterium]